MTEAEKRRSSFFVKFFAVFLILMIHIYIIAFSWKAMVHTPELAPGFFIGLTGVHTSRLASVQFNTTKEDE
jgi:uncharacterized membrane protein YccC